MKFTYTATNKEGKTISGSAEAANKDALISMLSKQGAKPIVIVMNNTGNSCFTWRDGASPVPCAAHAFPRICARRDGAPTTSTS